MDLGDIWAGKATLNLRKTASGRQLLVEGDGRSRSVTKIGGKGTKIYICNFVDNSADVFGGGGTPSGLWARGTYGYPTESATTADTIYINTEAGPASLTDKKVYLIYGFNHPTGNWPKVEMNINTNWASTGGAWYHYSLGNLSTGQLDYVICVEHIADGVTNTFWDNNGGGNYTMTIYPAPEPANFSFQSVSANPVNPEPESSTTITVILRTAPETDISALAARVGYDIYDPATGPADVWPTYPMTRTGVVTNNATNVLSTFTYVVDSGLTNGYVMKYYIAASNGASTVLYANNNGDNYSVVVQDWPAFPPTSSSPPRLDHASRQATVTGTAGANLSAPVLDQCPQAARPGPSRSPATGVCPSRSASASTLSPSTATKPATLRPGRARLQLARRGHGVKGHRIRRVGFNHLKARSAGVFIGDQRCRHHRLRRQTFGFYANRLARAPMPGATQLQQRHGVGSTFSFDWGVNWDSDVGFYRGFSLLAGEPSSSTSTSNSATIQINGIRCSSTTARRRCR